MDGIVGVGRALAVGVQGWVGVGTAVGRGGVVGGTIVTVGSGVVVAATFSVGGASLGPWVRVVLACQGAIAEMENLTTSNLAKKWILAVIVAPSSRLH